MNTNEKTQKQSPKGRKNQIILIEYEKQAKDGHIVTIVDSYRNILGRVYRLFDKEANKIQYKVVDHLGNPMFDKPFMYQSEIKIALINKKDILLRAAHQRRKEAKKEQSQQKPIKEQSKQQLEEQRQKELETIQDKHQEQVKEVQDSELSR